MLADALVLAVRELRRNALRSSLTMLGIVIGVAAVIVMVTIGAGATQQVTQQIASLGSNMLIVSPGRRVMGPGGAGGSTPFRADDADALARELPSVAAVAPSAFRAMTAVHGNANWTTRVIGTTDAYVRVANWTIAEGRVFSAGEQRAGASVCLVGATVRTKLFGGQPALAARIRLQNVACEVIGVLAAKGQSMMGTDQDDLVVLPLATFQRRVAGNTDVAAIQVTVRDGFAAARAQRDIASLMRERRHLAPGQEDDFSVMSLEEVTRMFTGTTQVLTALLSAVAAVSLLVGGIGIMNIMLVSVTERTREIGIRLAIGALERDVLLQFLVEATMLSSLGGVTGIVLALAASFALARALAVPFAPDAATIAVAFLFAAAVGVAFGWFPARKAARLDPIEALRHE